MSSLFFFFFFLSFSSAFFFFFNFFFFFIAIYYGPVYTPAPSFTYVKTHAWLELRVKGRSGVGGREGWGEVHEMKDG